MVYGDDFHPLLSEYAAELRASASALEEDRFKKPEKPSDIKDRNMALHLRDVSEYYLFRDAVKKGIPRKQIKDFFNL